MFGWNDSAEIGIPQIDLQHRQLFDIISDMHTAMREGRSKALVGKTLGALVEYTVKHFAAEEALMRSRNYAELQQHKSVHDQFTAKMKKLQEDHKSGTLTVNLELMNFLQKWLVDHIQGTDVKYAKELKFKM